MPPDRGRASKACLACRKQKTRCYESTIGRACLRCERLGQSCSLTVEDDSIPDVHGRVWPGSGGADRDHGVDERFDQLERTVRILTRRIDELESVSPRLRAVDHGREQVAENEPNSEVVNGDRAPAPLFVLRDVTKESGVQPTDRAVTNTPSRGLSDDIILKNLVSREDAIALLTLFQENYGRWVQFNQAASMTTLFEDVRRSPLLLCACCLIAVRHTTQSLASQLAPKLFREARGLVSAAMLIVPQPIEFFQASLVLSLWSTSIGQIPLAIDSWLLSGFALQHSIASPVFSLGTETSPHTLGKRELDHLCLWNHLCLVHLHYCVGTRRKAVLDRKDIDRCRLILGSDHATNFESRMVAEVHLYWIIYESCSSPVDLPQSQSALRTWREEWEFLFGQPRSQFVQMGFHFAQLLLYDQSLKSRSAAVRESLLSEMVRLSTTIINLAMDTTDERTRHLTDHIYHMIAFAAVTLCRLLHLYEEQLSSSHDLSGLDGLILSLVSWLHAIGLPSHVAHTMGDVVAAFHRKLRPYSGPSPSTPYAEVDPAIQDDFAQLFPEFYGTSFDMINGSMLPEYQPIT